ncbi:LytR/AlgR family response regulator transcription factor [uncultured Fibrella sp.]|uniref:LytR/AlgR family response regulator transcription factor n=1 Tax=uncultured Fibrella sp. TaxID=1284596 RepID=UPI0035C9AD95
MKRVPYKRGEQTFEPKNVLYLIGESNYSYVHLADGDVILSCRNLKWFADQWPTFVRLHKGALINVKYIQRYERSDVANRANYIVMSDDAYLPIARRRVPEVLGVLAQMNLV